MRRLSRVKKARRKGNVGRLVEALAYQDVVRGDENGAVDLGAGVRVEAVSALGELGDERSAQAVIERLQDPVPRVRQAAVKAAAAIDPAQARGPLVEGVLTWPDPPFGEARNEALHALVEMDDPALPEQLVSALAVSNGSAIMDQVTRSAVVSLASTSSNGSPEAIVDLLLDILRRDEGNPRHIEIMLAWLADHSTDDLIDALDDLALRESAATVLGALRESRAVPGLTRCLDDYRVEVRLAAARAMGEIRDVRSVEGLIRAVSDESYEVRRQAQEALDGLGTVGVVAGVSAVLNMIMQDQGSQLSLPQADADDANRA
jgi:HEAT repeat protein